MYFLPYVYIVFTKRRDTFNPAFLAHLLFVLDIREKNYFLMFLTEFVKKIIFYSEKN